jgi:multidrug efflux pump subunit AcrA (membrane-fusion protein)
VQATIRSLTTQQSTDGKAAKLVVTISVDDRKLAAAASGSLTVQLAGQRHKAVLAVPVDALLAQPGGGYAVEVVDGQHRQIVAVKLGLFASGLVEIRGAGLHAGQRVVTTA